MKQEKQEENTTPVIHNGSLYGYTSNCSCGVLVKESVMKKLAKLQQEHLHKVRLNLYHCIFLLTKNILVANIRLLRIQNLVGQQKESHIELYIKRI